MTKEAAEKSQAEKKNNWLIVSLSVGGAALVFWIYFRQIKISGVAARVLCCGKEQGWQVTGTDDSRPQVGPGVEMQSRVVPAGEVANPTVEPLPAKPLSGRLSDWCFGRTVAPRSEERTKDTLLWNDSKYQHNDQNDSTNASTNAFHCRFWFWMGFAHLIIPFAVFLGIYLNTNIHDYATRCGTNTGPDDCEHNGRSSHSCTSTASHPSGSAAVWALAFVVALLQR
jgi:hypothetical protein